MTLFKTPSEKIILNEKIKLTRLKKAYQLELDKLPAGTIQTLNLGGKDLFYLVREGFGKKDAKSLSHYSTHQLDELKEKLSRRDKLERELKFMTKELGRIERALNTDTIEEWVNEFKAKNPIV